MRHRSGHDRATTGNCECPIDRQTKPVGRLTPLAFLTSQPRQYLPQLVNTPPAFSRGPYDADRLDVQPGQ